MKVITLLRLLESWRSRAGGARHGSFSALAVMLAGCATASITSDATPGALAQRSAAPSIAVATATPTPTPAPTATPSPSRAASTPSATRRARPVAAAPAATAPPVTHVSVGRVYDVGDSVTLDVKPYLQQYVAGITVDGRVSRQWDTGVSIINGLRQSGQLPPTVVVDLGTNGTVTTSQFDAMMHAAAGATRVVFVTVHVPRSWQGPDNAVIRAGVARYPNTALADWYSLSQGHPEWFYSDGYHLTPSGSRALASLIASVV